MPARILKALLAVEGAVATLAYVVVAALLLGDVMAREFFGVSIWGAQKIAVFASIIAGMVGFAIADAQNAHMRPTFADGLLPFPWTNRLSDFVAAAIYVAFGWYACVFVSETYAFNEQAAVLYVPVWPVQLVLPYAFFSAALRHGIFFFKPELKPAPRGEG